MKAALRAIPGVSLPDPQGAFYAFPKFDDSTDSHRIYGRAGARDRRRAGARRGLRA